MEGKNPYNPLLETEIDLCFIVQYPHHASHSILLAKAYPKIYIVVKDDTFTLGISVNQFHSQYERDKSR